MAITISPEVYFHRHVKNTTPSLSFNLDLSMEGTGVLLNDPSLVFTFNGEAVSEYLVGGSGVTVPIGLTNSVNQLEIGMHELFIRVFNYDTQEEADVKVYLLLSASASDNYYPEKLNFESVRNVQLAEAQQVYLTFQENYTSVDLPSWLTLESNTIVGNGRIIDVKPKYFFETPNPDYSGNIVFHFSGFSITIPVSYKIHAGYDSSYSKSVHFTRDNDEMVFYKTINEVTFLRLQAAVKIFATNGNLTENLNIIFDLPFVENKAAINLGKEVESYIRLIERPLSRNNRVNAVYPPIEVALTASELKYTDFSVVNVDIIPSQKFLRGRNPIVGKQVDEPFWLAYRPSKMRYVTEQSTIFLQVFKPAGESIKGIKVFLNDVQINTVMPGTNGFNFLKAYFLYASFNVKSIAGIQPGDKISFEYEGISLKREFVVEPFQPYSFNIMFVTAWETVDMFEFKGPAEFGVNYGHETSETVRNYVDVVRKIETENPQNVILNTGWIYKSDAYLVDELIRSKKAFLLVNQGLVLGMDEKVYESEAYGNIELIPTQAKIINHQSDENKVSFDVEFKINKRHADEIYSR